MKRMLDAIQSGAGEGTVDERALLSRLDAALANTVEPTVSRPASTTDQTAKPATSNTTPSSLRIEVSVLDQLLDLVGELVITKNQLNQFRNAAVREHDAQFESIAQRLSLITSDLQDGVMRTRMQAIGTLWNKLPRMLRDLSATLGKTFRLETHGAETELDRTIIEIIRDPLTHIIRNACDHGIELPQSEVRRVNRRRDASRSVLITKPDKSRSRSAMTVGASIQSGCEPRLCSRDWCLRLRHRR